MTTDATQITPIALAFSPYQEKFAIPRQPGLATAAITRVELLPPFNNPLALDGLDEVSHVWLLFLFHAVGSKPESLRVRPPRLGGNEYLGVFATRSTHRPNGIGQSLAKIEKIEGTQLWVSGVDLLNQTPIIDIKPYVPYADVAIDAFNRIAPEPPPQLPVVWQADALASAKEHALRLQENVALVIEQALAQDPRPAYQQRNASDNGLAERTYGARFWDLDVRWCYPQGKPKDNLQNETLEVISVTAL